MANKADDTHGGGCLCGAVRYAAKGPPLWVVHCHCQSCRRSTGSPVSTFAGYGRDKVAFTDAQPAVYASSPGVRRSFCPACGTPIAYEADKFAGEIHLYACTMDAPEDFVPTGHVHVAEKVPWLHLADGQPRYATTARESDPLP